MTWFLGGASLLSLLMSSLSLKVSKLSRLLTFAIIFTFLIYLVIKLGNGGLQLVDFPNFKIWTLLVIEGILFWLFSKNSVASSSIIPKSSVPILTSLIFAFSLERITKENVAIILSFSLVYQHIISAKLKDWDYLIRKAVIGLVLIVFVVLTYYLQGEFSVPLVIFIYWFVSELIPLGIENKNEDNIVQPIANRILLICLFSSGVKIEIPIEILLLGSAFIGIGGSLSVYFSKSLKSIWKNFRRCSEALLLIIFLSFNSVINENAILGVLTLSFYSFLPLLMSETEGKSFNKAIKPLSILTLVGFMHGGLKDILLGGLLYSKLEGIGLLFTPLLCLYWLPVYALWARLNKRLNNESKIDHLSLFACASAIIMSVIISF